MPYTRASELPDSVKKALPKAAQAQFMHVVNSQLEAGMSDERAFASAWSVIKKKWRKDEKTGTWHRINEGTRMQTSERTKASKRTKRGPYREAMKDLIEEMLVESPPVEQGPHDEPLTEEMLPSDPRAEYLDGCYRDAIYSAMNLLSHRALEITSDERDALTSMVTRIVRKLGLSDDYEESERPEAVNLDALQDATERLLVEHSLSEAGQRHRNEDYQVFDQVLELVKKLRGLSPAELKIQHASAEDTPQAHMLQGYRGDTGEGLQESYHGVVQESIQIIREADDGSGLKWDIVIIEAGKSKNKRRYTTEVLKHAAPLFEGCRVYAYDRVLKGKPIYDHLSEEEMRANPHGYARDLCGFLSAPRLDGSRLVASLTILPSHAWVGQNVQAALKQGLPMPYGFSIDSRGTGHWVEEAGEKILEVESIEQVNSTDLVTYPAAGGAFLRLVASVAIHEMETASATERESLAIIETLRHQMKTMQMRMRLHDVLNEHEITGRAKADILAVAESFLDRD